MKPPIFSIDFRKGSIQSDTCQPLLGQGNSPLIRGSKGYCIYQNKNDSFISYNVTPYTDVSKPFSVIVNLDILKSNFYGQIFTMEGSNYSGFGVYGREIRLWNTYTIGLTYNYGNSFKIGNQSWVITYDGNKSENSLKFYINNIIQTKTSYTNNLTSDIIGSRSTFYIGRYNAAQRQKVYTFQMYDYVISDQQRQSLYQDFLDSKPTNYPVVFQPNLNAFKPHEIREQGLVAAYNFQATGNKLMNIAWDNPANGYNAQQYNFTNNSFVTTLSDSLLINNKGRLNLSKNFGKIHTIHFRFKYLGVGGNGFYEAGISRLITTSTGLTYNLDTNNSTQMSYGFTLQNGTDVSITIVRNNTNIKFYLNGKLKSESTLSSNSDWTIQSFGYQASQNKIQLNDLKIYNRILSDQEIKDYYNQFASKIVLKEDFSQYPSGATKFGNWKGKDVYSLQETTVNDSVLKHIKSGTKFIQFYSGLEVDNFGIPSKVAYGTWEFDIWKPTGDSSFVISIIEGDLKYNQGNNYTVSSATSLNNAVTITNVGYSTIFTTSNNFINPNTWYRLKVTRTLDGVFRMYIKGGQYGKDYIIIKSSTNQISVTDNMFTTCNYFAVKLRGARIANIQIKQGIEV